MPVYVKIYDMFQQKEKVMSKGAALNRLKHAHFQNGGRWCALNEVDFYNQPPPEPEVEEVDLELKYDLKEVKVNTEPPSVEDAEELPSIAVEQTVTASKSKAKTRTSSAKKTASRKSTKK